MSEADLVRHVARLARLSIEEGEAERLGADFARILGQFQALEKAVPPSESRETELDRELCDVLREDVPREEAPLGERLLENAPEHADGFFRVPKAIGDDA